MCGGVKVDELFGLVIQSPCPGTVTQDVEGRTQTCGAKTGRAVRRIVKKFTVAAGFLSKSKKVAICAGGVETLALVFLSVHTTYGRPA